MWYDVWVRQRSENGKAAATGKSKPKIVICIWSSSLEQAELLAKYTHIQARFKGWLAAVCRFLFEDQPLSMTSLLGNTHAQANSACYQLDGKRVPGCRNSTGTVVNRWRQKDVYTANQ